MDSKLYDGRGADKHERVKVNEQISYPVITTNVSAHLIAAARQRTSRTNISREINRLLDAPWRLIWTTPGLQDRGRNVALYWELDDEAGVEVGVEVVHAFADTDTVVCSQIPSGRVATTPYFGDYAGLETAHAAIVAWCKAHDEQLVGPFWEIYGHWEDDAEKRRTDVFYLLT